MSCVIASMFCFIGVVALILISIMCVKMAIDLYKDGDVIISICGLIAIMLFIVGGIIALSYMGVDIYIHPENYLKQ